MGVDEIKFDILFFDKTFHDLPAVVKKYPADIIAPVERPGDIERPGKEDPHIIIRIILA